MPTSIRGFDSATDDVQDILENILGPELSTLPGVPGFSVQLNTASLGGEFEQVAFFDEIELGMGVNLGQGALFTSGEHEPPLTNTDSGFTVDQSSPGDIDLDAVATAAFPGSGTTNDASTLEFDILVTNPNIDAFALDVVFGSDEFPEFSDSSFIDIAAVFVNGENFALFNGDPAQPLSVLQSNIDLGNFIDNNIFNDEFDDGEFGEFDGEIPDDFFDEFGDDPIFGSSPLDIEYDGVSEVLTIIAPVSTGSNTVKIGVADTGDFSLDSGLFVSNLRPLFGTDDSSGVFDNIIGGDDDDTLMGSDNDDSISGGDGDDTANGGAGGDVINGDGGNDSLSGDGDDDVILGGFGDDTASGGDGADTINGEGGNDSILGGGDNDSLLGWGGNDTLEGGEGNDTLLSGSDDDLLIGGNGNDSLNGFRGEDTLFGGNGNDTLKGGDGEDILIGGDGSDILFGGADADLFGFGAGDTGVGELDGIRDFEVGVDAIDLSGLGYTNLTLGGSTAGELRVAYSAASDRTYIRDDFSDFEFYIDGGDLRGIIADSDFLFV